MSEAGSPADEGPDTQVSENSYTAARRLLTDVSWLRRHAVAVTYPRNQLVQKPSEAPEEAPDTHDSGSPAMQYTDSGLMTQITHPNGGVNAFTYDADGRLLRDIDPEGGGWQINHSENADGSDRTEMISGEGRVRSPGHP